MTDRAAMLLAIQADPGDDTRRLAFADHLDEHAARVACPTGAPFDDTCVVTVPSPPGGSSVVTCHHCRGTGWVPGPDAAWAELIRYQCRGATGDRVSPRPRAFTSSVWALLSANGTWSRGFIDTLSVATADLFAFAPRCAEQLAVVERVVLTDLTVFPSGGNSTWYVGGLGRFPRKYWSRLDGLPSRQAAEAAASLAAAAWCHSLIGGAS